MSSPHVRNRNDIKAELSVEPLAADAELYEARIARRCALNPARRARRASQTSWLP